jgi:pyrroloquinoline quinone (PQQ) biosynthesis protein C
VDLWTRLEQARSRWNVLEHPFYRRWSAGELRPEELAHYAGQYRHAVVALARATENAAKAAEPAVAAELEAHAQEEQAHVGLWDDFARATGAAPEAPASPETAACAAAWAGEERSFLGTLAALYAIESGQPAISQTKQEGLASHYGIDDEAATRYFAVHARRDHEHAAAGRAMLDERLADADLNELVVEAELVLRANWELLDGVERHNRG